MSPTHEHHGHGGDDHGHGHGHGSPFIQHHYDDAQHQFDSAKLGIWFFLVQEILFFSALFVAYTLFRHHRPEIFAYAHHYLDTKWGAINTGVLILSSLTAAWSVRCAQLNQRKGLIATLSITILCACGFLVIKYIEYSHKIHEHILYGAKFDPCITPTQLPLLNKGNECPGHKSSVLWDATAGQATAGCMEGDYDADKREPGIQGTCKVAEVKVDFPGGKRVEKGRRELPPCQVEKHGKAGGHGAAEGGEHAEAGGHHGPANTPCWQLATNPYVCPKGPAAMVLYGDHEVRGREIEIQATCDLVPPAPASTADPFADIPVTEQVGAAAMQPIHRPTKHELDLQFASGPPPEHTNMFFSIYFAMTGLHGIHVLAGVVVYLWLLFRAIRGHFTPDYFGPVDFAALYWHLVDLIWIFLFPLLYLIH
jgi:cytochrome c oxidase subunit III